MKKRAVIFVFAVMLSILCTAVLVSATDFVATEPKHILNFVVIGDTTVDYDLDEGECPTDHGSYLKIMNLIGSRNPEFVVHLGDMVCTPGSRGDWARLMSDLLNITSRTPVPGFPVNLFPVMGNGDNCNLWEFDGCEKWKLNFPFSAALTNPSGRAANPFYSFSYGDAYFIVINSPNEYQGTTAQQKWFISELNRSANFKNLFIFSHYGAYMRSNKQCGQSTVRSFFTSKINSTGRNVIFFNGHDHTYAVYDCSAGDGGCGNVKHITSGGAGEEIETTGTICSDASYKYDVKNKAFIKKHHYLLVSFSENITRIRAYGDDNLLLHEFYVMNATYLSSEEMNSQHPSFLEVFICDKDGVCESDNGENQTNCANDCLIPADNTQDGLNANIDDDHDGVSNENDYCPNTLGHFEVNLYGCPTPPMSKFPNSTNINSRNLNQMIYSFRIANSAGKIEFNQGVRLLNGSYPLDIDDYVTIQSNSISIASQFLPGLNKSATLTFYNITFENPVVLKDGTRCTDCIVKGFEDNIFSVEVPHFTTYQVVNESYFNAPVCNISWQCSGWTNCLDEVQTRICTDVNNCNDSYSKPIESQPCVMMNQTNTPNVTSDVIPPSTCIPNCTNVECGDDGCGGQCWNCEENEYCDPIHEKCQKSYVKIWVYGIIGSLVLLLLGSFFYFWRKQRRLKQEEEKAKVMQPNWNRPDIRQVYYPRYVRR